jgi:methionyl-tRNA synthetase
MTRRFVSAGWPYLYDVPGLHNCVPMLFGDVMARFYRLRGDDVYFLCGADEHGARVEYVAEGLGCGPGQVVDDALARTRPLLAALGLSFDDFGRTADPEHVAWVQAFFADLKQAGALGARDVEVAWCDHCARVLPDRFVEGACPSCGGRAFGNQCQDKMTCARMLHPAELVGARCAVCQDATRLVKRSHWALPLAPHADAILEGLGSSDAFVDEVRAVAKRVLDETKEVVLTRDFAYGVPVEGPDARTVSVDGWADALLAKLSFAELAGHGALLRDDSAERVYFLGRDGIPFYAVLLPALLAACKRGYSLARRHLQPNQVFVDEGGICSKSTGTGIWLAEALASAPAELWRFYVYFAYAARAQEKDVAFRWERFAEVANAELVVPMERLVGAVAQTLARGVPTGWREHPEARTLARAGAHAASEATQLLDAHRTGRALFRLLAALKELDAAIGPGGPSVDAARAAGARDALRSFLPLLACYLPTTAQAAWSRLGLRGAASDRRVADGSVVDDSAPAATGPAIFPGGPLRARDAQRDYQRRVEERRRARSLEEEITAARADKLCACPSELDEA